jgi:hypothetical protein
MVWFLFSFTSLFIPVHTLFQSFLVIFYHFVFIPCDHISERTDWSPFIVWRILLLVLVSSLSFEWTINIQGTVLVVDWFANQWIFRLNGHFLLFKY